MSDSLGDGTLSRLTYLISVNSHNLLTPRSLSSSEFIPTGKFGFEYPQLSLAPAPKKRRRIWLRVLGLGLLTWFIITLVGVALAVDGAFRIKTAVSDGQAALEVADFTLASDSLERVRSGLLEVQRGFLFLTYLRPVPWIGEQLKVAQEAIDVSLEVTGAMTSLLIFEQLSAEDRHLMLSGLSASLPELREAQVRLSLASKDFEQLNIQKMSSQLRLAISPLSQILPDLAAVVDVLVPVAAIAPEFAGLEDDKQFLTLFLNNAELRPNGGFIGIYNLAEVRDGEIVNMSTSDSYAVDALVQGQPGYHVNPPPPIATYLNQPVWYFRDANWSPDFGETARTATQLMRQEIAFGKLPVPQIDGVIGITPDFVSRFLNIVGPITVSGVTFTADNLAPELEYQVEQAFVGRGIAVSDRKDIVALLGDELINKLAALPTSAWPELFKAIQAGAQEKEFALMSFDPKVQAVLTDNHWAAVIRSNAINDTLLVVDANMASLKTNAVVERDVKYSIIKTSSGYRATAEVNYTNQGSFDWKTTRYRTYTRLYVPLGSKLVSSSGSMLNDKLLNPGLLPGQVTVSEELGMTSFGAFIAIEPGESGTLSFTYDLPASVVAAIENGTYQLLAQKQMGAGDNPLTLDLDFGKAVVSASPAEESQNFGDNIYHVTTELKTDELFTVSF